MHKIPGGSRKSGDLLYEFLAETRLIVYRRLDIISTIEKLFQTTVSSITAPVSDMTIFHNVWQIWIDIKMLKC